MTDYHPADQPRGASSPRPFHTDDAAFRAWALRTGLPPATVELIDEIRRSAPSRAVTSRFSVTGRYPSRKMRCTIQFESHRGGELQRIHELEHDDDVLAYYDQPSAIPILYPLPNGGRRIRVRHTPDFFVIRTRSGGWEEVKPEAKLWELASRQPGRWRLQDGTWRCPPAEEYAERLGLSYSVWSSAQTDWVLQRNIEFLDDYIGAPLPPASNAEALRIIDIVAEHPGITLSELRSRGVGADLINTLIAGRAIHVDLGAAPLSEPNQVHLFRDPQIAASWAATSDEGGGRSRRAVPASLTLVPGTPFAWDDRSWTVLNVGANLLTLRSSEGAVVEMDQDNFTRLLAAGRIVCRMTDATAHETEQQALSRLAEADERDLAVANQRFELIRPYVEGSLDEHGLSRSIRRYLAAYREADGLLGHGLLGLLPRWKNSGNRTPRLPEEVVDIINATVQQHHLSSKQLRAVAVWGLIRNSCIERGLEPPSYNAVRGAIRRVPEHEATLARRGRRAAYQVQAFHWALTPTTPRHGEWPFHIAHVDHTLLDVEVVSSTTGKPLGRPWLTLLMDAFSRRVLAITMTFDPPSAASCMMVVRECVRRHARLPQILVCDGGKEFQSTYFETLLAAYGVTKKTRPPAQPRAGSVCERLFGTVNTEMIHRLLGNTQITRNVRQVTKAVTPSRLACWPLGELYDRLSEYCYEVYDQREHPALGQSPREAHSVGIAASGNRPSRMIPYDDVFRMLTLPSPPRRHVKVDASRGIRINYLYYWSEEMRSPRVAGTRVEVRYDPFDAGTVYAYIEGAWRPCVSERYADFHGRTVKEVLEATVELRRTRQIHGAEVSITAQRLAAFLTTLEADETRLKARLREAENAEIHARVNGAPPTNHRPSIETPPARRADSLQPELIADDDLDDLEEYA